GASLQPLGGESSASKAPAKPLLVILARVRLFALAFLLLLVLARKATDEIDDRTPDFRIGDLHERFVQLDAFAAAQAVHDVRLRLPLAQPRSCCCLSLVVRPCGRGLLVEELGADTQHLRELIEAAPAYSIDALLVFLNLLEGETKLLAELLLAHSEQHPLKAHATADVKVKRIGPA